MRWFSEVAQARQGPSLTPQVMVWSPAKFHAIKLHTNFIEKLKFGFKMGRHGSRRAETCSEWIVRQSGSLLDMFWADFLANVLQKRAKNFGNLKNLENSDFCMYLVIFLLTGTAWNLPSKHQRLWWTYTPGQCPWAETAWHFQWIQIAKCHELPLRVDIKKVDSKKVDIKKVDIKKRYQKGR